MYRDYNDTMNLGGYALIGAAATTRLALWQQMLDDYEENNFEDSKVVMQYADSVLDAMGAGADKCERFSNAQIYYWCLMALEAESALQFIGQQRLEEAMQKVAEARAKDMIKNKRNIKQRR